MCLAVGLIAVLAGGPAVADLAVVPFEYDTIQEAIDAVQGTPDATVRIDSNAAFEAHLFTIEDSVRIVGGTVGGEPARPRIHGLVLFTLRGSARGTLTLEGLRIRPRPATIGLHRMLSVVVADTGLAELHVVDCSFSDPEGLGYDAIEILGQAGSFEVEVTGSDMDLGGEPDRAPLGIDANGTGSVAVRGTSISIDGDGTAIYLADDAPIDLELTDSTITIDAPLRLSTPAGVEAHGGGELTIARSEFVLNATALGYPSGVYMAAVAPAIATLDANVFGGSGVGVHYAVLALPRTWLLLTATNNVVTGVNAGVAVQVGAGEGAHLVLVNNTIDDAVVDAVSLGCFDGATLLARLFNNLITRSGGAGLSLDVAAPGFVDVLNDYNGWFGNIGGDLDGPLVPDPHGFFASPEYEIGTARPVDGSPVRDRGLSTAPGLGLFDVAGSPRIEGFAVDLGAYEVPEPGAAALAFAALASLSLLARRRRASAAAFVCLAAATAPARADLAVVPVPYATIQSAVDAVQGTPDALVRIDSHGLFPEQVVVSESVAITGGTVDGNLSTPSIVGGISFVPDGAGRKTLRLERLYVIAPADADEGSVLIRVDATGSGVAALECTTCVLRDPSAVGSTGIVLDAEGSLDVDIHGSRIESSGRQPEGIVVNGGGRVVVRDSQVIIEGDGSGIRAASYAAPLELEILRDGIEVYSYGFFGGHGVFVVAASDVTIAGNGFYINTRETGGTNGIGLRGYTPSRVTIDANRIETSGSAGGFGVEAVPRASMLLVATNNLMRGGTWGFALEPDDGAGMDALLVNNTIDDMATAAITLNPVGGTLVAGIFNNLLTRSYYGISISPWLIPTYVVNDYNGYWGNTENVDAPLVTDPHGFFGSPLYAPGGPRPLARSPVIDRGLSSVPGLPLFDIEGNPRILGDAVDLGAYEVPEPGAIALACAALASLSLLARRAIGPALVAFAAAAAPARADLAVVPVPYATIQSAIDAVEGTPEATVRIDSSAVFPEQVVVSESVAITGGTEGGSRAVPSILGGVSFMPDGADRESLRLDHLIVFAPAGASEGSVLIRVDATGSGVAELGVTACVLRDPSAVGPTGIELDAEGSLDVDVYRSIIALVGEQVYGVHVKGGGRVAVRESQIRIDGSGHNGISARSYDAPLALEILDDEITLNQTSGAGGYGVEVVAAADVTIARNAITLDTVATGGLLTGIGIRTGAPSRVTLDANRISAIGAHRTFALEAVPKGSMLLVATNNVVSGGIRGFLLMPAEAVMDALVVNNTLDGMTERAIHLYPVRDALLVAAVFNNLLSRSPWGISVSAGYGSLHAVNDYNGYFGNTEGDVEAPLVNDPNGFFGSPLYAPGMLRPRTSSPVIDRGLSSVPGLPLLDVEDQPRILGDAVDLGAYEVPEPSAALAVLAALLVLGARGVLRR